MMNRCQSYTLYGEHERLALSCVTWLYTNHPNHHYIKCQIIAHLLTDSDRTIETTLEYVFFVCNLFSTYGSHAEWKSGTLCSHAMKEINAKHRNAAKSIAWDFGEQKIWQPNQDGRFKNFRCVLFVFVVFIFNYFMK